MAKKVSVKESRPESCRMKVMKPAEMSKMKTMPMKTGRVKKA